MYFIRSPIDSLDMVKKSGKKDNQTSRIRFITSCQSVRYHIFILHLLSFRRSILHFLLMIHLYWKVHDERRITLGLIWIRLIPSYQSHQLCHPWSFIFSRTLSIPFTNNSQSEKRQWRNEKKNRKCNRIYTFRSFGSIPPILSFICYLSTYPLYNFCWWLNEREKRVATNKTKRKLV